MSAKLLYSLSDNNQNLQKQFGCMNGFIHFFDRHHLVNSQTANIPNSPRLPLGEFRQQDRAANGATKRSKGKILNGIQKQGNTMESSRISVSSSSASTTTSSFEREWGIKNENSSFNESLYTDKPPWECRVDKLCNLPHQTKSTQPEKSHKLHKKHILQDLTANCPSPIKTAPKKQVFRHTTTKHVDSPRFLLTSKLDSPKFVARNESFRSISSNQSAPMICHRIKDPDQVLKDAPRFSFDGRETYVSSLRFKDSPRLSLDSRQQNLQKSVCQSTKDSVLRDLQRVMQKPSKNRNIPEEPHSNRPPSNIVAKLMGLEALPNNSPPINSCLELKDSSIIEDPDFFARSSKRVDENKVRRGSYSPRNGCRESKTQQSNKGELIVKAKSSRRTPTEPGTWKPPQAQAASGIKDSKNYEASPEPQKQTLTVYGEIEKRLTDIDFKRSGKDLRALKQILESMHKEKTNLLSRQEIWSTDHESGTSTHNSTYTSQNNVPVKSHCKTSDGIITTTYPKSQPKTGTRSPKDLSRDIKQTNPVRETNKAATFVMHDLPPKGLHRLRLGQHSDVKDSAKKKTRPHLAQEASPSRDLSHQGPLQATSSSRGVSLYSTNNFSGTRNPRIKTASKSPPLMATVNITSPAKISRTVSSRMHNPVPVRTISSGTKQQRSKAIGMHTQHEELQHKSCILQDINKKYKISKSSATCSQGNTISLLSDCRTNLASEMDTVHISTDESSMTYSIQQLESDIKNAELVSEDTSSMELGIIVREQPSPVSVLDAMFYGDESPSPVKKKPTVFRDYEIDAAYTGAEFVDLTYSDNVTSAFSHDKLERLSESTMALCRLNSSPNRKTSCDQPEKEANTEKAYVSEILSVSGFQDNCSLAAFFLHADQSEEAINPRLFFALEQTKGSTHFSDIRSQSGADTIMATERHQRKLLFDIVNEILSQKLAFTSLESQPQLMSKRISRSRNGPPEPSQEIWEEISQLHRGSLHQSSYDEDDFLTTMIGKDFSRPSGNWTNFSTEIQELALDIERLIFKDLIDELVHPEATKI